jgi:hypothetical protein
VRYREGANDRLSRSYIVINASVVWLAIANDNNAPTRMDAYVFQVFVPQALWAARASGEEPTE